MATGPEARPPIEIVRATGDRLDAPRLQAILALRSEVFVVEQSCHYQDVDGLDLERTTVHLWIDRGSRAPAAYLRLLDDGTRRRIGRVVTAADQRGEGLGAALVRAAVDEAAAPVVLSAQSQLTGWYEALGFVVAGAEYLDAGIPHTPMRLP
jgi:ElaA protein